MNINLSKKIDEHYRRVELLAKEAADDDEETYSSRAAAMSAVSKLLQDLTKTQADVINMSRLMKIERAVIQTVKAHLTPDQHVEFLKTLEEFLDAT